MWSVRAVTRLHWHLPGSEHLPRSKELGLPTQPMHLMQLALQTQPLHSQRPGKELGLPTQPMHLMQLALQTQPLHSQRPGANNSARASWAASWMSCMALACAAFVAEWHGLPHFVPLQLNRLHSRRQ